MDLLAAEITARTGKDPGEHYRELTRGVRHAATTRASTRRRRPSRRRGWRSCRPRPSRQSTLAGEPITAKLTRAPGNNAPIGGLKVVTASGWFAARPSGTENIYKIYAESFKDERHLQAIVDRGAADRGQRAGRRRGIHDAARLRSSSWSTSTTRCSTTTASRPTSGATSSASSARRAAIATGRFRNGCSPTWATATISARCSATASSTRTTSACCRCRRYLVDYPFADRALSRGARRPGAAAQPGGAR